MNKLNIIDLFAGCGGLSDGFEKTQKYNMLASVEWNKKANDVLINRLISKYKENDAISKVITFDIQRTNELLYGWTDDEIYGSHIGLKKLICNNKVDLIVGGPPCQAYSVAGRIQDKNQMKDDYRNYLFESYMKIVDYFNPKLFVFENVEGMLSAKPGGISIIDRIKESFNNSGYYIIDNIKDNALINLWEYGVPQKRKRVILIGLNKTFFGDNNQKILNKFYNTILPKYKSKKIYTVYDAISDLQPLTPLKETIKVGRKQYSHGPIIPKVDGHISRYHSQRDIEIFRELAMDIELNTHKYDTTEDLKKLYTEKTGKTSNIHKYNVLKWNEPSNTIPAHLKKDGLRHIHPDSQQARSITVREAARLQTFDDDFKFTGIMSSDFEMIGNAVPPLFAQKLANAIYDLMKEQQLID